MNMDLILRALPKFLPILLSLSLNSHTLPFGTLISDEISYSPSEN